MLGHVLRVYLQECVVRSDDELGRRDELLVHPRLVPGAFALVRNRSRPGVGRDPGAHARMSTQPRLQVIDGGKPADSRSALRELYTQYGGTVYSRCQYLLGDRTRAEDAMQDVFAKALGHWHEFR